MKQMLNSTCGIKPETIREIACTSARRKHTDRTDIAQGTKIQECDAGILQIFGSAFSYINKPYVFPQQPYHCISNLYEKEENGPRFSRSIQSRYYSSPPLPTTKQMVFSIPF